MTSLNKWRGATDGRSGGCVCVGGGHKEKGMKGSAGREIEVWRGKKTPGMNFYLFFWFSGWAYWTTRPTDTRETTVHIFTHTITHSDRQFDSESSVSL